MGINNPGRMRNSGFFDLGVFFSIAERVMGVCKGALNILRALLYFGYQWQHRERTMKAPLPVGYYR